MTQDNATSPTALWAPPRWLYRASVAWGALLGVPLCLFVSFDIVVWAVVHWRQLPILIPQMTRTLLLDVLGMALAAGVYFRPVVQSMRVNGRPGALLWVYPLATVAMPAVLAVVVTPLVVLGVLLTGYTDGTSAVWAIVGPISRYLPSALLCLPPVGVLTGLVLYVRLRPEQGDDGGVTDEAGPGRGAPSSPAGPPRRLFAATVLWGAALGALAFVFGRYPAFVLLGRRGGFWTPAAIVAIGLVASGVAFSFRHVFRGWGRSLLPWAYPLVSTALAVALMPMAPLFWSAGGYRLAAGAGIAWMAGSIQPLFLRGEPVLLGMIALGVLAGIAVARVPRAWLESGEGVR